MANIPFLSVIHRLQTAIPGAAAPHLVEALRQATVAFCDRSEAYTYKIDPITTVEGIGTYEIDLPPQTRVVKVLRLSYEGDKLIPNSETHLDNTYPKWETETGTPKWYFFRNKELTLAPAPQATNPIALSGMVALKPTLNASQIDEDFFEENYQGIFDLALGLLYAETANDWANPSLAVQHKNLGEAAIMDAVSKSRQDHTAKQRVMPYAGY